MLLHFVNEEGRRQEVQLTGRSSLTFGRSPEADVVIPNARVSRIHAEIKFWDGDYVIKDLKSRNGTFVNDQAVAAAVLKPGDTIKIGGVDIRFVKEGAKGAETIVREVSREIEEGKKGYRTILREIVQSTEPKPRK